MTKTFSRTPHVLQVSRLKNWTAQGLDMKPDSIDWDTCARDDCVGVRYGTSEHCLAHLSPDQLDAALIELRKSGSINARGVPFTDALLQRVLGAFSKPGEPPAVEEAIFHCATFEGEATFRQLKVKHRAMFDEAIFRGGVGFWNTDFQGETTFKETIFEGGVTFGIAPTFRGPTHFDKAIFKRGIGLQLITFDDEVTFNEASFEQARQFGPVVVHQRFSLDDAVFGEHIHIIASAATVLCRRASFVKGAQLDLRWCVLFLDGSDFSQPSILTGTARRPKELDELEKKFSKCWAQLPDLPRHAQPRLLSLRNANVAGLTVANVDVSKCHFAGAHNLDKLHLESDVSFATTLIPFWGLGRRTWHGRQVIAEECAWRAKRPRTHRWVSPAWPRCLDQQPEVLQPTQIAGLYRALRKGREDIKDEPGAADFYYGEMEMRRRHDRPLSGGNPDGQPGAPSRGRVERGIVGAYWLVSGYGLRAWRAVACLAVITGSLAVAFHLVGFTRPPQPVSYWTSLLYAFRATLSLTNSDVKLTAWGQLLQGLLRLTGPVLLGLALLAVRGRVKR